MHVKFETKSLAKAVKACMEVVPSKTTMPLLQHLYVVVTDGKATIFATDSEMAIEANVEPLIVHRAGEVLIPAKTLNEILQSATGEHVEIKVGVTDQAPLSGAADSSITVVMSAGSKAKYVLPGHSKGDTYPKWEFDRRAFYHTARVADFNWAIDLTLFAAASKDSDRIFLRGVLFTFGLDLLSVWASDSRRSAKASISAVSVGDHHVSFPSAVIQAKAVAVVKDAIAKVSDDEDSLLIQIHKTTAVFSTPSITVACRLMEAKYLNIEGIAKKILSPESYSLSVDVVKFARYVRQAAITADREFSSITLTFSAEQIVIKSDSSPDSGSCVETEIPCPGLEKPFSIKVSHPFLVRLLQALESHKHTSITLKFVDNPDYPLIFQYGDSYLHFIMPLVMSPEPEVAS